MPTNQSGNRSISQLTNTYNAERPRIIYAWNYCTWGGVQIYFLSLIKAARKKFEVIAVLPENSAERVVNSLQDLGVELVYSPPVHAQTVPNNLIERIRRRLRIILSESRFVNVVLGQIRNGDTIIQADLAFWHSALSIVRLCRKAHVFFTIHTALERHSLIRDLLWKFKGFAVSGSPRMHFLASNEDARRSLAGYIRKRAFDDVAVTYAGFDPREIENANREFPGRDAVLKRYGLSDRPLIVTVGQFIERKGCRIVVASLEKLIAQQRDFTFVWLSTAMPDKELLSDIDRDILGDHFQILSSDDIGGSRTELFYILRSADVFVLASLQEGLPVALVEAMALGRACLVTNINAIPEAVQNGVSGIVIEPNDPNMLADELSRLIDDPDRRSRLGASAREVAFERFNENATAEMTIKRYDAAWKSGQ